MIRNGAQIVATVPDLDTYQPHSGIGRVLYNLSLCWGQRVRLVSTRLVTLGIPLLRTFSFGVHIPEHADLVLLPRLTGAHALRNTNGVPSLVIVHDIGFMDFPGDREGMDWVTCQAIERSFWGLTYASHIVAVSRFSRDRILHYLPDVEDKISVIPNMVAPTFLNQDRSKSESRRRISLLANGALGDPLLIYVGAETPRKNVPLLLQVLHRVKESYPKAQLLKVGQAGGRQWRARTLNTAEELRLEAGRDILFLEDLEDTILADAYHTADVFVSASLYEGFGYPALEAMAAGTPVVVTTCGSYPETIGAAGQIREPDADQLSHAVQEIIEHPAQARERTLRGLANLPYFDLSGSAERYLQLIHDLVATHRTERAVLPDAEYAHRS